MKTVWGGDLEAFCVALVIIVACIAALASMAMKIAIEKDWVVVICHGDKGKLASKYLLVCLFVGLFVCFIKYRTVLVLFRS